jgi:transcriptional regulator with XRE-family HTH domain
VVIIVNKEKMGMFIRQLRREKDWSQDKLANKFEECHLVVTKAAIGDWEKGKTIPVLDNLIELSNIFNVSVDEILDGERFLNIDYAEKYFIVDDSWLNKYSNENLFEIRQNQIMDINKRFKELLKIRVREFFSRNEEKEFEFLFNNFYRLTDYYKEYIELEVNDEYMKLKMAIKECLNKNVNMKDEEKIWEIRKMIVPNRNIDFNFNEICDNEPEGGSIIDKRFKQMEFWEKDMILSTIQKCDPIIVHVGDYGAKALKRYEERTGKEYDKDTQCKEIIKYLIKNGACINRQYLSFIERKTVKKRIIDRVEYLYNLCKKPIIKIANDGDILKRYKIENTPKNRFIFNYYWDIKATFDYSVDELYSLVMQYDDVPEFVLMDAAKKHGIDTNQERKYIMSDLKFWIERPVKLWQQFKDNERLIEEGLIELEMLIKRLENGDFYCNNIEEKVVGGNNPDEIKEYCYYWNRFVTKKEIENLRMKKETSELFEEIDVLSMEQIRDKYFKMEVYDK